MGSPKLSETHKRTLGQNILTGCKLRQAQMLYLLETMHEPVFVGGSQASTAKALSNAFGLPNGSDEEILDEVAITYRIMNHQGFGRGAHEQGTPPSYQSVAVFMNSIQNYLPKHLRSRAQLWKRDSFRDGGNQVYAAKTKELLERMCEWLVHMKERIEDMLSQKYLTGGKFQHLEILKRRFKGNWSERTEQSIDADVNTDTTVNIIIDDYTV